MNWCCKAGLGRVFIHDQRAESSKQNLQIRFIRRNPLVHSLTCGRISKLVSTTKELGGSIEGPPKERWIGEFSQKTSCALTGVSLVRWLSTSGRNTRDEVLSGGEGMERIDLGVKAQRVV